MTPIVNPSLTFWQQALLAAISGSAAGMFALLALLLYRRQECAKFEELGTAEIRARRFAALVELLEATGKLHLAGTRLAQARETHIGRPETPALLKGLEKERADAAEVFLQSAFRVEFLLPDDVQAVTIGHINAMHAATTRAEIDEHARAISRDIERYLPPLTRYRTSNPGRAENVGGALIVVLLTVIAVLILLAK